MASVEDYAGDATGSPCEFARVGGAVLAGAGANESCARQSASCPHVARVRRMAAVLLSQVPNPQRFYSWAHVGTCARWTCRADGTRPDL